MLSWCLITGIGLQCFCPGIFYNSPKKNGERKLLMVSDFSWKENPLLSFYCNLIRSETHQWFDFYPTLDNPAFQHKWMIKWVTVGYNHKLCPNGCSMQCEYVFKLKRVVLSVPATSHSIVNLYFCSEICQPNFTSIWLVDGGNFESWLWAWCCLADWLGSVHIERTRVNSPSWYSPFQ